MKLILRVSGAVVLPLLIAVFGYVLVSKGVASEVTAAWAQAVGAVAVIWSAFLVANDQAVRQTRRDQAMVGEALRAARLTAFYCLQLMERRVRKIADDLAGQSDWSASTLQYQQRVLHEVHRVAQSINVASLLDDELMFIYTTATNRLDIISDRYFEFIQDLQNNKDGRRERERLLYDELVAQNNHLRRHISEFMNRSKLEPQTM